MYGVTLVLLGSAEFALFAVRDTQPATITCKRLLLLSMLLADAIHIPTFCHFWFFGQHPASHQPLSWSVSEAVAVFCNIVLLVVAVVLRLLYIVQARPLPPAKKKAS